MKSNIVNKYRKSWYMDDEVDLSDRKRKLTRDALRKNKKKRVLRMMRRDFPSELDDINDTEYLKYNPFDLLDLYNN